MKKVPLWTIIISSLAGIVVAILATIQYYQIANLGFEHHSFCTINAFINCDVAYASSYAQLWGIPVSWLGIFFYLWNVLVAFWLYTRKELHSEGARLAWGLSIGSVVFSLYKAYIALVVLHVLCLLCLAIYLLNFVLFFAWQRVAGVGWNPLRGMSGLTLWQPLALTTLLFFGVGFALGDGLQKKWVNDQALPVSAEEMIAYHFRQSEYQWENDPSAPVWGNPEAKVVLAEFSDFQCPFCKHAAFQIKPAIVEFKDKIQFRFFNFPLDSTCNPHVQIPMHPFSCLAAKAAVCAEERGDFWGYHDDIFRNQEKLDDKIFLALAKQRGWDEMEFQKCIDSDATLKRVQKDIEAGNKIYVNGTPTLLLNNRRVKYWTDRDVLRAIIKEEIRRTSP